MTNDSEQVLAHLGNVLRSIDSDLVLALKAHEDADRGGFMSIPRQVFCYVDYLGFLASSKGKRTDRAIAFMERYFARVNPEYAGNCELLYDMWRHGSVHEYDAKVFVSQEAAFRLQWGANNTSVDENRKWHLKCMQVDGQPGSYHWFINLFQLVDDLAQAVREFSLELETDADLRREAGLRYREISGPVDLDRNDRRMRQARKVISAATNLIDEHGNVLPKE